MNKNKYMKTSNKRKKNLSHLHNRLHHLHLIHLILLLHKAKVSDDNKFIKVRQNLVMHHNFTSNI
jgi:hypothetical protein